jgi:branched-chain amino acid transport system substrate-binding protein
MTEPTSGSFRPGRRRVLQGAAVVAGAQLAAPFLISARGEVPVKIGMVDEMTGPASMLGTSEHQGALLAVDEINAKGGILGRKVELLLEDSASDTGVGVQKAIKLIDRDKVNVLLSDPNSGIAYAQTQVTYQKGVLNILPGAHTDPMTGKACKWNVFRICGTTSMDANSITGTLVRKFGKRWFMITPDYAYGHTLQAAFIRDVRKLGGTVEAVLVPQTMMDFTATLIKAKLYKPTVLINNMYGQPQVNCMKQFLQFGMEKSIALGGAIFELEDVVATPAAAQTGWWNMEWWWNQPGVPHVAAFNAAVHKRFGVMPSARVWFGYVAVHSFRLAAEHSKGLDALKMARALEGMVLPPEVALQRGKTFYRAADHQLMATIFVGEVHPPKHGNKWDVFTIRKEVPGESVAATAAEDGCHMTYPS